MIAHRSPKAFHYINLLQEEPQQHFYNIHQNRGKHALEWLVMYCCLSFSEVWIQLHLFWKHTPKKCFLTLGKPETTGEVPGSVNVHRNERPPSLGEKNKIHLCRASLYETNRESPFHWKLSKPGDIKPCFIISYINKSTTYSIAYSMRRSRQAGLKRTHSPILISVTHHLPAASAALLHSENRKHCFSCRKKTLFHLKFTVPQIK